MKRSADLGDLVVVRGDAVPGSAELSVIVMSTDSDPRAIEAARSVLSQPVAAEVVVVNTGEGSLRSVLSPVLDQIVLVEAATRLFPGGTRNLGIAHSSAPIVAFLAADCLATDGWNAARVHRHREGHASVGSSLRPVANLSRRRARISWASYVLVHPNRMPETPLKAAGCYGRSYDRSLFDQFGVFDETVRIGEDTDFNRLIDACSRPLCDQGIVTLHRYPETLRGGFVEQFNRARHAHLRYAGEVSRYRHLVRRTRYAISVGLKQFRARGSLTSPWIVAIVFSGYVIGTFSTYFSPPVAGRGRAAQSELVTER